VENKAIVSKKSIFAENWTQFASLVKFKLTITVVFSAVIAFLISIPKDSNEIGYGVLLLFMGGFFITSAANILNEVLERDYDRLMKRTAVRPLVTGKISVTNAILLAGIFSVLGILILSFFNPLSGVLGALSLVSYAFLYTPLKRITPWAVAVGALPGALPTMIGCVAATGHIDSTALTLFTVQFLWQFPHFWAIAWVGDDDYKNAGFYLLPTKDGNKSNVVGLNSLIVSLFLFPVIVLYDLHSGVSLVSTAIVLIMSLGYTIFSYRLFRQNDKKSALGLMFYSFFYLPFVLFIYLIDKLV